MAEGHPDPSAEPAFGVETIHLDLAPLAGTFGRRLREAGLAVTPERSAEFARALTLVRPESRRRLYWTARAIFVTERFEARAFDAVFGEVFGEGSAPLPEPADDADVTPVPADERASAARRRPPADRGAEQREPSVSSAPAAEPGDEEQAAELPVATAAEEERLAGKSFESLSPEELARLYAMMSRLELATPLRRTRRFERARHGRGVDMRRTLRGSLRTAGDPIHIARRRRRVLPRRLVLLCDISGSMEPYARAYLQFLSAAARSGSQVEAFSFATRLTRLSRALAARHPERAIQRAARAAPDWSSGTRIGAALGQFNDRYGRRGIARGAVVVILSDGWERGDPALVGREMERLARLANKIVWVNPRLAAEEFAVGTAGMRAALGHCDAFVSGHSFEALAEVVEAIAAPPGEERSPQTFAGAAPQAAEEEEAWPSATPLQGSSVAMPSGYGPSRGRTTPGWGRDGR